MLAMEAQLGDRIVIRGRTVESADRHGEIIEVRGTAGGPPYVIRFDNGSEAVVQPGPDFTVEHREHV
jgi:hypothetical protein